MTREKLIKNGMKYQFKNEVENDKHILTLSGVVAKPDWIDRMLDIQTINAEDIAEALDDVEIDILVRLNSGGGDAFEGIEIYNYLKRHSSHVTVEVTALAASAASIIAMGGDEVIMNTGTSMMIHQASTIAWGDKIELNKALNALETIDDSIVDIYAERTGLAKDELDDLLVKETWFTADQAVEKGFADKKSSKQSETVEGPVDSRTDDVSNNFNKDDLNKMLADFKKEVKAELQTNKLEQTKAPVNKKPKRFL